MKNITTLITLLLFTAFAVSAQVGIGTTNPQETLHVSGNESTIRIEGLNSENNNKNLGGASQYNVMVDAAGNLTLGNVSGEISSESNVATPVVIQTTASSGLNSTELYTKSFTLTQRALVVITYYISVDFKSYDGATNIADGRAKIAHNYFYIGNGTTANTSKAYGMTSSVYSNSNCDTATGYVYNSRSTTISLAPGTYSVHLNGAVFGGDLTPDAAFRATFGDLDRLDIEAIYL
ncbi:hypothetical protein ATE92_1832 [Ulvibacter sp. MAR_2010_11]|uniref:hypothetical protein n=1 Tax=Ulvibacter sp. MAR_2010_11 TaxID=1250229 RepID=UPI000C2BD8D1|nr:hypothetical protein [Ulvibacter sp. MAR_2010_11]PKA83667.1 hypothetical protein ATE92_1832 [Ulvibacter sp. MAR_2010_11]